MKFPKEFKHMKHKKGIMVYVHINGSVKCHAVNNYNIAEHIIDVCEKNNIAAYAAAYIKKEGAKIFLCSFKAELAKYRKLEYMNKIGLARYAVIMQE